MGELILTDDNSAVLERRQRAREAFYDAYHDGTYVEVPGVEDAIETATRVRVTQEIVRAAIVARDDYGMIKAVEAAFRAAGFEVEE